MRQVSARKADLPMPWPILIQTGTVALGAPVVTDGFMEWLAVVSLGVLGWLAMLLVLVLIARDRKGAL